MNLKNSTSLIKLLNYSISLHKDEIDSLKTLCKRKKSNSAKWFELIYSILVGTQIKTERVKYCFDRIIEEYYDLLEPRFLHKLTDFTFLRELINDSLKENGYRFHKTKSIAIYNCLLYFKKFNFNIDYFIKKFKNYKEIRQELINIKGIGLKIASHWLRNIGYIIPVVDIHIKNLFYRLKIVDNQKLSYLSYETIQNELSESLKIDNITFDLALWLFGKNFCGNRKCKCCKINCRNI
ncbi:MAG: hypothetical protein ACFFDF_23565 [Candidatus Odinarchaeota archaeon]